MFHTFQTAGAATSPAASKNHPKTRRQSSTTHACEECRRRKIRCDGKQPCSHCEWYKHPKLCRYAKKQPRVVPSQKLLDELSTALRQSQRVVEQLFPHSDVKTLGDMPRAELVDLILALPASQAPSSAQTTPILSTESSDMSRFQRVKSEDSNAPLEALEEEPAADGYWDETETSPNGVPAIPDDVNALSMSVHRQSSYVGVSSVAAALRVISKITTALESVLTSDPPTAPADASRPVSSGANELLPVFPISAGLPTSAGLAPPLQTPTIKTPGLTPSTLIDSYFVHVHPMIPMIDETRFRTDARDDVRRDAAWLALLNMVYAMGTIAASTADDNSHLHYYKVARQYMDLDLLGSSSIEAVQALGILGGYYLHYESKPNMASAVMGAAMRMACALGLHREYADNGGSAEKPDPTSPEYAADADKTPNAENASSTETHPADNATPAEPSTAHSTERRPTKSSLLIPREVRRRTWWSLFCLDTWASTAAGRPSLGRISQGVNVALPSPLENKIENPGSETTDDDVYVLLLCQQTAFCKIATRVQDRLAESPLLPADETARFDAELRYWYNNMPPMLRWPAPCPDRAKTPRAVLSWRYHNLRLILHRPTLLNNALRSSLENPTTPSEEELRLVNDCRRLGGEAIADIRNQWEASQIAGWNAVWLLFQAAMVPLVTLFAAYNRNDFAAVRDAQVHVQSVIDQLEVMQDWSITAKRSRDVVSKIFERNKLLVSHAREVMELQRKRERETQRKRQQESRDRERAQQQQQQQVQQQHRRSQSRSSASPVQQSPGSRRPSAPPQQLTPQQYQHQQQRQHTPQQQRFSPSPHLGWGAIPSFEHASPQLQQLATQNLAGMYATSSASPPSAISAGTLSRFPDGLMPPAGSLAGHMGMDVGGDALMTDASASHWGTNYIDEDELNAFWNQIMWGDADTNAWMMMDMGLDGMPPGQGYGPEQHQAQAQGQPGFGF